MQATNWTRCSTVNSRTISSRCFPSARASKKSGLWDDTGTYRVVYTARLADAVYVLHVFQKKTQATAKRDIELAKKRFIELMRGAQ